MEPDLNVFGLMPNITLAEVLKQNITLEQMTDYFNKNLPNFTNQSEETQKLFDLYEAYRTREREQLSEYKYVAFIIGTLIILSNITVVISSGLILKKGQQPKSTYLLLGNVSLADTIIGISIIFGALVDTTNTSSNNLCIFQIGMLVCPAMVSIFSVGLIAIDRYIYILHGLYYQRWFNTTKVRFGIVCIWLIGITFGFMPATGAVNEELTNTKCDYPMIFPVPLVIIISLLSCIPVVIVAVLYSVILIKTLAHLTNIKVTNKPGSEANNTKLRAYRGNGAAQRMNNAHSVKFSKATNDNKFPRSASFAVTHTSTPIQNSTHIIKSKSTDFLNHDNTNLSKMSLQNDESQSSLPNAESSYSVYTVDTIIDTPSDTKPNSTENKVDLPKLQTEKSKKCRFNNKAPKKLRAVLIVMLTSLSFILTWMPLFITAIIYALCEEKCTNPECHHLRYLLDFPLSTLAFSNSLLNPLIYAWWHKGFKRSVKMYYMKYCRKHICRTPDVSQCKA